MVNTEKKLSKVFQTLDRNEMPVEVEQVDIVNDSGYQNESKMQQRRCTISHTEADVNWAIIANKITVPNIVKSALTLGGFRVGATLGGTLGTGLGFALLGPSGAALGFSIGSYAGLGGGAICGHKLGKFTANIIENEKHDNIVEKGTTEIKIDTAKKVDVGR